jgi:hypothetical protein
VAITFGSKGSVEPLFFFERPFSHEDYKKANTNKALDSQGAFSHSRWSQIGEIHVLFPSEAGHFYIARRADLPHYQEVFSKFVTALESFDDAMVVYLYLPERNYKNHFLTVRNSLERVQPFVDQIDWMEVHRLACRPKQTIAKKSVGRKRQDTFEDTGFCSSVNQTREGTLDGVAEPRMKPGTTTNSEVTNAYVVLSKFLAKTGARWSSDPLYYDPLEPQRQKRFAGRIHVDNVFECMRMSVTDLQSKCACHRDEHNSTNPAFSAVVGLSVVRKVGGKEVRIAINAQGRRSIDDCLSRSTTYGPLIAMVVETFESMPPSRQILSKSSFDKHNVGGMAGFLCTKSPCHMDPMSFYQPFLHYSLLLVNHFGLSFPETVSIISAIEVVPNTAYWFSVAAQALLCIRPSDLSGCHRGFAFGYLVASLVLKFRTIRSNASPGRRFCMYWDPELPSGEEWESRCLLKTHACLRFHAAFGSLVDKKKRATQYKKLRVHFCSNTKNADILVTNHVLCIASCLGLLPGWVRGEVEVGPSCRYMKWFRETFDLPSGADTTEQITENVSHVLSSRNNLRISVRKAENVLCKTFRTKTKTKKVELFWDLAFWGQMLFTDEGDGLRVSLLSNDEFEETLVDNFLITEWAFGNTRLSVEDINGRLGMSDKGVPLPKEECHWSVPDELMYGRKGTKVQFDMAHKVDVKCEAFLRFHLELVSKKLRR